ncbi:MAG: mechanosensitive ion channel domain-containing protein [Sphingomicrobium sp.]
MRNLDPIRPTQSVIEWLIANREGVMIGALVALVIVGLMLIARLIGARMVAREAAADSFGWRSVIGSVLARTGLLFMIMAAIDIVATYAEPPERAQHLIDIGFTIAFAIQAAVWARELILAIIARRAGEHGDAPSDSALHSATAIIRVLVSVALFALAIVVILDNLGVNVTALVAGLGIGGIAIGLAAQGIFADLFAALAILFDKPFRRGDTIQFDTAIGRVERIGLKTTRLRALGGEQIIMANTKLLEREIHNLADGRLRRATIAFGVAYETPPEKLARMEEFAEAAIGGLKGCRLLRCSLTAFGTSSLDHQLVYENKSVDPERLARDRAAIMLALIERFAAEEIRFSYPVQIAYVGNAAR